MAQNSRGARRRKWKQAAIQSLVITACLGLCFVLAHFTLNGLLITSIAASTFIAFAFPMAQSAKPKILIGGYLCAIATGLVFHYLSVLLCVYVPNFPVHLVFTVLCAFAAAMLMMLLDFQHPPAMALAISIVLDATPFITSLIALVSIVGVSLVKLAIFPWLSRVCAPEAQETADRE